MVRKERRSVGSHLEYIASVYPNNLFFISNLERLTYREFDQRVDTLAKGLLKLGIKKSEKVSVWMPNRLNWLYLQFAIARIGAILVPISTRFKAFEAEYILRQSDTSTLIMVDIFLNNDFMTMMHEICPEIGESSPGGINSSQFPYLKNVIVDSKKNYKGTFKFEELFNWGSDSGYEEALRKARSVVGPDDIAIIAYTSGTTGSPKGAMLTHDSVSRHLLFVSERIGLDKKDRVLFGFPLYHLGGCVTAVMPPLLTGACLLTPEYFDPEEAMRIIEKEKCTTFFGVHTMVQMIIEHPNFGKYNLKSLKKGVIGGAACPTKLIEDIIAKLGYTPLNFYGMTECATCTTGTPKDSTPPRSLRPSGKPQMITR